jgi:subtilisin family serine protease
MMGFLPRCACASAGVLALALVPGMAAAGDSPPTGSVRLVIGFRHELSSDQEVALVQAVGMTVVQQLPELDVVVATAATSQLAPVRDALRQTAGVEYEQIDPRASAMDAVPSDPLVGSQYALGTMHVFDAWAYSRGSAMVRVAVLDTGVDYTHPDLVGRVDLGADEVQLDGDPMEGAAGFTHGTHVAGIIGAIAGNGIGISGAAPDTRILAVRVLDATGSGYASDIAAGVIDATDAGASVINLSLGGSTASPALQSALVYARLHGAVPVCAAGNEGATSLLYPAAFPECIAVAATDSADAHAEFSNAGAELDVSAPGVNILSTLGGGTYGYASGTSMATPYVSAVAALVLATGVPPDDVQSRLQQTADDLGPVGYDTQFGAGRVNALRAVNPSATMPPPVVVPPPAVAPPPAGIPTPSTSPSPAPPPSSSPSSPLTPVTAPKVVRGAWQSSRAGIRRSCGARTHPCRWRYRRPIYLSVGLARRGAGRTVVRIVFDRLSGRAAHRVLDLRARVSRSSRTIVVTRSRRLVRGHWRVRSFERLASGRWVSIDRHAYFDVTR